MKCNCLINFIRFSLMFIFSTFHFIHFLLQGNLYQSFNQQSLCPFYNFLINMSKKLKNQVLPLLTPTHKVSEYSNKSCKFLKHQYTSVKIILKSIEDIQNSLYYKLRYPLYTILKAVCKKLLLNMYESIIFGYLLHLNSWRINDPIIQQHKFDFPDIIFINDPTNYAQFKKLSLFLLLTCYSIKEFLNADMGIYLHQLKKLCDIFEQIHLKWIDGQDTNIQLDPRKLNQFYISLTKKNHQNKVDDYNELVDKIIYISPCYANNNKNKKISVKKNVQCFNPTVMIDDLVSNQAQLSQDFSNHQQNQGYCKDLMNQCHQNISEYNFF